MNRNSSPFNAERGNEIINYLVIYWEYAPPSTLQNTSTYFSSPQTTYHGEHLF